MPLNRLIGSQRKAACVRLDGSEGAREMDENPKCQMESAAKIVIGEIGAPNKVVHAVRVGDVGSLMSSDPEVIRGPAAIRMADVADYGQLMGDDEPRPLRTLTALRQATIPESAP